MTSVLDYSPTQKAYDTCEEMFVQRGYNIVEKDDERILAIKEDGKQICAFISKTVSKFNVERIQECISMMKEMDVSHGLIVYKDTATPVAKKIVEESQKMKIELFHEKELQYNLTKHYLVPLHELKYKKDNPEAIEFKKNKYPMISQLDPVARFYGWSTGDIIKVTRKDGFVMFRIVGK
jgi:DNA-directed RNA polymerase I, II, and III subunit RPABC1